MSGSFQFGDYSSGHGVDHYGGHSGGGYHEHSGSYHDEKCCPLVVDALCLAAILGAIAGATVLLQRVFMVELCMVNGAAVALFVANCRAGRRKRSDFDSDRPWWHGLVLRVSKGKNYEITKGGKVRPEWHIADFRAYRKVGYTVHSVDINHILLDLY